jgi:hypothetical protein
MLKFLIDNIFAMFGVWTCISTKQSGTNCVPLLADLILYSCEAYILVIIKKKLAWSFNITFRYIDDVLSLNNCGFSD